MEELIPPGFRFYPTEEELLSFYLRHKLDESRPELNQVIPIVDIYAVEPWELPRMAGERCRGDTEQWFFFMPQQEREARGGKPTRTTMTGYWKATGSPGYVYSSSQKRMIGVKKTMVFYRGRAPTGRKTKWKMNEYKCVETPQNIPSSSLSIDNAPMPKLRHEMSICRVYITSGSSRAFDRRPSALPVQVPLVHEAPPDATTLATALGPTSQQIPTLAPDNIISSMSVSGSSNSGGEDQDQDRDYMKLEIGGSSNTTNNFDDEMNIDGLEPLWEWEQLNWP